jgi:hypothetical protein
MARALLIVLTALVPACAPSARQASRPPGAAADIIPTSTGILVRLDDAEAGTVILFDADARAVWDALPVAFEALGIPAGVMDEDAMTYGNPRFTGGRIGDRRTGSFVRCGGSGAGSAAGNYRIRLLVSSRVEGQVDGRSLLLTTVSGMATTVEGTSTAPIRCVSDGQLEELIAGVVADVVARR